jgi:hypothetical protein
MMAEVAERRTTALAAARVGLRRYSVWTSVRGGAVPATRPSSPDERALVIPVGMRRGIRPRRGGVPGPAIVVPPTAVADAQARYLAAASVIDRVSAAAGSEPDLVAAMWAYRVEGAGGSPRGAGALAAVCHPRDWRLDRDERVIADAWVASRGVVFAACAAVEFWTINGSVSSNVTVLRSVPGPGAHVDHWDVIGGRVREHLAVASDDDYAVAVAALTPYRCIPLARAATSFLLPTQRDWVDEDVRDKANGHNGMRLLIHSVNTAAQLAAVVIRNDLRYLDAGTLGTILDGVGSSAHRVLLDWLDHGGIGSTEQQRILTAIAAIPTDAAMRSLIERSDRKYVAAALADAVKRFPVRATRLLTTAAAGAHPTSALAAELLRVHVIPTPSRSKRG